MLSLRMTVFAGIAGICFWGLFALLDNLKEPGLLRTTKGLAVKGCDRLDAHADAPKLCPALLCEKALLDRKVTTLEDRIEITRDAAEGADRVVAGRIIGNQREFECVVQGVTVTNAALVGPAT